MASVTHQGHKVYATDIYAKIRGQKNNATMNLLGNVNVQNFK